MTEEFCLRDRIAMSTPQPGLQEIRELMGLSPDTPLAPTDETPKGTVQQFWMELSNTARWEIIWKWRYTAADAALRARASNY